MQFKNYRGICLLNTTYKVLAKIIYNRLLPFAEGIIGEYQCGFREARSTVDQIFCIRQIMEKAWEHNIGIHQLFIDFKQAYDSVDRSVMWNILKALKIPMKLINIIKATLENTNARVVINGKMSEQFEIKTGLRQGDSLSTILFNLVLDYVIQQVPINQSSTIFNCSSQILAFADDVDVIGRTTLGVKEAFISIDKTSKIVGLQVSEEKSKYLLLTKNRRLGQNLTIDDYNFEVVDSFKYLGSIINSENEIGEEIKMRILQGNKSFFALKHLFKSSILSRRVKTTLYTTIVRPVVIYGSEAWTLTKNHENMLCIFERKILRRIYGGIKDSATEFYRSRTNAEIETLFNQPSIVQVIKAQRIRWAGHVARMGTDRMPKRLLERTVTSAESSRKQGRPKSRWIDQVEADLKRLNCNNWKSLSQDRQRWKNVVASAYTLNG